MKHVIIGTAGHVDHGKTVLVKALTGTDTDRLAEEKKKAAERTKKIFTVAVCVILVLALALPTMAVALLGGGA